MTPFLILAPSRGWTAGRGPALLRMSGSVLATKGGMYKTTKTGAGKSAGSWEITSFSVSTPPAEAPITIARSAFAIDQVSFPFCFVQPAFAYPHRFGPL